MLYQVSPSDPVVFVMTCVAALLLASTQALAQGNVTAGKTVFENQCASCHPTEPGKQGFGPSLAAVMGRLYVTAFERAGVVATPKHFVANVGEGGRDSYPIDHSERAFPAFGLNVQTSAPLDGPFTPLAGPVTISVEGGQATAGSRILEGYRSPYDAHITERLRDAGAVILGKTNMDEFAMGSST